MAKELLFEIGTEEIPSGYLPGALDANKAYDDIWRGPRPTARSVADYAAYKAWWMDTGRPVEPEEWASARAVRSGETVVGQVMQIERFDGTRAFVSNSAVAAAIDSADPTTWPIR